MTFGEIADKVAVAAILLPCLVYLFRRLRRLFSKTPGCGGGCCGGSPDCLAPGGYSAPKVNSEKDGIRPV